MEKGVLDVNCHLLIGWMILLIAIFVFGKVIMMMIIKATKSDDKSCNKNSHLMPFMIKVIRQVSIRMAMRMCFSVLGCLRCMPITILALPEQGDNDIKIPKKNAPIAITIVGINRVLKCH
tara:strand:+ start:211 stop:570 length:360 start_codon:yes stop_codon:yes gene_type:complete